MKNKFSFSVFTAAAVILIANCSSAMGAACCSQNYSPDSNKTQSTIEQPGPEILKLASDNTTFAINIYSSLKNKDGNLFFSPYSISSAMAMVYLGARGKTEEQIKSVMNYSLPQENLHQNFSEQNERLKNISKGEEIQISISNSIWPHKDYQFLPEYIELLKKYYKTEVTQVDYVNATEAARQKINEEVEKQTLGKITNLIPDGILDSLTRLVLTNAVYFKGLWNTRFDPENTKPAAFNISSDITSEVQMMFQNSKFRYYSDTVLQAVELPYKGGSVCMLILLPREIEGINDLEESLSSEMLSSIISEMYETKIKIYLPRFSLTSEFNLSDTLKSLGMPIAFSNAADFSGMDGTQNLLLTNVLHKAYVGVDEEGTEAAAATAAVIGLKSVPMFEIFKADHPFLFLICDCSTGTVLFMGRVSQP